jgi:2-keto-3-deoxy-L-rhamnonate aldolase RhmA
MKSFVRISGGSIAAWLLVLSASLPAADVPTNNLVSLLAAGRPAIGVWTGALSAPRIAKVLATSDVDFIVADVEHDIYDFPMLHRFLLEVQDFHRRFRTEPRPAPAVLIKLGHRGGWDPRYEIAESLKVGPASGVWVPMVESRAEMERIISTFEHAEQSGMEGMNFRTAPGESPLWPHNPKGQLLVVAMIETETGVKNAREIIETPGLAAVHTVHLSEADAASVLKLCLERKVIAGTDANPSNIKAKLDAGYKLISLGWDFGMLQRQLTETIKGVRSVLAPSSDVK